TLPHLLQTFLKIYQLQSWLLYHLTIYYRSHKGLFLIYELFLQTMFTLLYFVKPILTVDDISTSDLLDTITAILFVTGMSIVIYEGLLNKPLWLSAISMLFLTKLLFT